MRPSDGRERSKGPGRILSKLLHHEDASENQTRSATSGPANPSRRWPAIETLVSETKDWQINHGSLMKLIRTEEEHTVLSRPISVSLVPTQFARTLFDLAQDVQEDFNVLYASVAQDPNWLQSVLEGLIAIDDFPRMLWSIHEEVQKAGCVQEMTMGIFRSDYMLDSSAANNVTESESPCLKQVELNTIAVAGAAHAQKVCEMHQQFSRKGLYSSFPKVSEPSHTLPFNDNISLIVSGLKAAHTAYGAPKSTEASQTCILMIVQPFNINVCDERPIEYELWKRDVPIHRLEWDDVLTHTALTPNRELMYHYPINPEASLEVSVIYMRAGFELHEYSTSYGRAARLRLELSCAINCPSILSQISTFKAVQAALTQPGAVERFLHSRSAEKVRSTFARFHELDRYKELPVQDLVLKPAALEGGGHNMFGSEARDVIGRLGKREYGRYVLMERIKPPKEQEGVLMTLKGVYEGETVGELGVLGVCLWRLTGNGEGVEIMESFKGGWTFKTKPETQEEMSVVKGYGCFDTPCLC